MNVIDAAHHTVHGYPGGAAALAIRMVRKGPDGEVVFDGEGNPKGMSAAVLSSKVNPNTQTHHLTLVEASEVMGLTSNYLILHSLAAEHGFTLQRMAPIDGGSVVDAVLNAAASRGEFDQLLRDAYADRIITENEMRQLSAVGAAQMEAMVHLLARLRAAASTRLASAA